MRVIKQFLKIPAWATGSTEFLFLRNWIGVSAGVLLVLVVVLTPTGAYSRDEMVIIRNDHVPLDSDLAVGRFGVGKLFFDDPLDLDTDEDNNVYILDAGNYRVQIMDEDGDYLGRWGKRGKDEGEFDEPVALSVDPEHNLVYVLDREKRVVYQYEINGEFIVSIGKKGIRKGEFEDPIDLTVDFHGNLYVLDRKKRSVLKFHRNGDFIDEWRFMGRKKGLLTDPVSIAFSENRLGSIFVLNRMNKSLVRFDRKGAHKDTISLVPAFPDDGEPRKIRSDNSGNLFILEGNMGKLIKFERSTYSIFGLISDKLDLPKLAGLAIDDDDRVYVTDLNANRVIRFILEPN